MVLNAAVQMLREADELKEKISKFKNGTSMLQERSLWTTQQQLQKIYQKVLVLDLDYALDKKVEQDLWNVGFKQQIEALQSISKDRKNPLRSEGQAMLSWVLQTAAGFYLCLLHQICTAFQLDLPFRRRASLLGWVEGWGAGEMGGATRLPAPSAARYICQHCLVHLGDLARYRQQLRVAHTFYRHALVVWVSSGQPYNQLALVAWRRGRRLHAVYWHVRSLLVRAPFPPAHANLARTLQAAATTQDTTLPVLPGLPVIHSAAPVASTQRYDAHTYVTELLRAAHFIHTNDELEKAKVLVNSLNSSLTTLIATDSFEWMTLIKMACVLIWLVHSSTEDFTIETNAMTDSEAVAAHLSESLASGALLALLLPAYTADAPLERTLAPLKVWLEWCVAHPRVLACASFRTKPALWPALAHSLNHLANNVELTDNSDQSDRFFIAVGCKHSNVAGVSLVERQPKVATETDTILDFRHYASVPLPEDEELHGFLPLEASLASLRFPNHASWDTYGDRLPSTPQESPPEVPSSCLSDEPEVQKRVRAHRLVRLGKRLTDLMPDQFTYTEEEGKPTFTAASVGGEELTLAIAELSASRQQAGGPAESESTDGESDDGAPRLRPPIVISEADFREKVREKRAGILKPQGSLERAREERAMATQEELQEDDEEASEESNKFDDKRENRKPRVNIAMAAIMRKQEETNKQVKFVTPAPTPDSTAESTESKEEKPKIIQPKVMKSLANIPIGKKTGGILSLKDKSGYPHLVNTDPEPKKDKEEVKKEPKASQTTQPFQPKREHSPSWSNTPQNFTEPPRMTFQKHYGIQNTGISYNPNYQPGVNNQGIRLPVVNPKEIDVRTAAMQKQNSRQDMFQEHKFNPNYQISGDKKNFLNDLPPRFANQYRYWQNAQENQYNDNKFRDDNFKPANPSSSFNQRQNWAGQMPENFQQPPWWKPDNPPNFNYTPNLIQPSYFSPVNNNVPYNVAYNPQLPQPKPETYLPSTIGQPMQTLQSLVSSPNFNSTLNSFNTYPPVTYDSAMYPQFSNKLGYQPMQLKPQYQAKEMMDLGFQNNGELQRNLSFEQKGDMELKGEGSNEAPSNTYSLFSGAPNAPQWGSTPNHPPQSLWSGPGPSPLERLLEQQKQMKPPQ